MADDVLQQDTNHTDLKSPQDIPNGSPPKSPSTKQRRWVNKLNNLRTFKDIKASEAIEQLHKPATRTAARSSLSHREDSSPVSNGHTYSPSSTATSDSDESFIDDVIVREDAEQPGLKLDPNSLDDKSTSSPTRSILKKKSLLEEVREKKKNLTVNETPTVRLIPSTQKELELMGIIEELTLKLENEKARVENVQRQLEETNKHIQALNDTIENFRRVKDQIATEYSEKFADLNMEIIELREQQERAQANNNNSKESENSGAEIAYLKELLENSKNQVEKEKQNSAARSQQLATENDQLRRKLNELEDKMGKIRYQSTGTVDPVLQQEFEDMRRRAEEESSKKAQLQIQLRETENQLLLLRQEQPFSPTVWMKNPCFATQIFLWVCVLMTLWIIILKMNYTDVVRYT